MAQIATKFVQWDVPELATLQGSRVYKLREHLNNGGKLNREDKNWITRNVSESTYFKRGIALSGYHFDFSDVLKRYFVKQYGHIQEYYAIDKTALRSIHLNFIKTVKSQVGKETISLWKPTVMRKQRQSSGPGVAKMFRISLTAVFLMEEVRLCVILPSFCFPKKTMVTRLLRFSTRKENLS